jgi:hypothetical protein
MKKLATTLLTLLTTSTLVVGSASTHVNAESIAQTTSPTNNKTTISNKTTTDTRSPNPSASSSPTTVQNNIQQSKYRLVKIRLQDALRAFEIAQNNLRRVNELYTRAKLSNNQSMMDIYSRSVDAALKRSNAAEINLGQARSSMEMAQKYLLQ